MRKTVPLAVLLAAAALALAGCGGEEESEGTPTAAAGGAAQTVEIRETEFALEPANANLASAGTYTFRAVNDGSIDHALEIEGSGVEEETETIGGGESGEVTVELAEGTYEMYCPIGNHRDQGMEGTVVVGAGAATTTNGETTTDGTTTTGETETAETETDDDSGSGSSGYGY